MCRHVLVHASSPLQATSAHSVNRVRTYGKRPLWSVQICWITGNLCLNQVRQIAYQGGGGLGGAAAAAAAAGSDLWHSNCTVKCSMDM